MMNAALSCFTNPTYKFSDIRKSPNVDIPNVGVHQVGVHQLNQPSPLNQTLTKISILFVRTSNKSGVTILDNTDRTSKHSQKIRYQR